MKPDHILIIGFGGPEKPEDVRKYLEIVTRGRNIPEDRLREVEHHYDVIGGASPYNRYTRQLADRLKERLQSAGITLPVFLGMRNWNPFLQDTLSEIHRRGLQKGIGLVLAPHRSEPSYDRYLLNVQEALEAAKIKNLEYGYLRKWHDHPRFVEAQAEQVKKVMASLPVEKLKDVHLIFTVHSIPEVAAKWSAYEEEVKATSQKVAERLGIPSWSVAYQSRSGSPNDPWLEPEIGDVMRNLVQQGKRTLLLVPTGFLCDNAEVLYDLDVEARQVADELKIQYHRASTVMDHPSFVDMWVELIQEQLNGSQTRSQGMSGHHPAPSESFDIQEKGAPRNGQPQVSNRRMYFQLLVFSGCSNPKPLIEKLQNFSLETVLYCDANDPYGVGILLMSERPEALVKEARCLFASEPFLKLKPKPEMTMLGRTYSIGREADLEDWLLKKPRRQALNPKWPWAVWYPLRRKPEFATLTREEQGKILMEHAILGQTYGASNLAFDVRLACYGIDKNDNEFVIGLLGPELYPLSRIVQDMRKTVQTSKYIQSLGPFFVGHAVWQSAFKDA